MPRETEENLSIDQGLLKFFVPWTTFESPMKPTDLFSENVFECIQGC